jgi:hypothetical protein
LHLHRENEKPPTEIAPWNGPVAHPSAALPGMAPIFGRLVSWATREERRCPMQCTLRAKLDKVEFTVALQTLEVAYHKASF